MTSCADPSLGSRGVQEVWKWPREPLHGLTCYSTELITLLFVSEQEFWCQRSALWSSQSRQKMGQVKSLSLLMKSLSIGPHTCTVSITRAEHGGKSRSTRQKQRSHNKKSSKCIECLAPLIYMKIMFGSFNLIYVFMHGFLFVSTPGNDFLITGINASVQQSDTLWINILLLYTLCLLDLLIEYTCPQRCGLFVKLAFFHIWYLFVCCIFINLFSDCSFKLMGAAPAEGRVLISLTQFQ